jgi:DNA mismatch repair protein MutL
MDIGGHILQNRADMNGGRIRILPERVRSMIAAGEVVERPASVVKELVENSIDAGSRRITIEVQGAGKRKITVSDDGCGMGRNDAVLAFERHATSKIRDEEDLRAIRTFGFRGEALPSIAAVSKVRMLTRTHDSIVGTEVVIEGGRIKEVRDAGCPPGTIVEVSSLFFNTPARLKSLKGPLVESGLITATVMRMAIPHPDISFRLLQDGKEVLAVSRSQSVKERISEIFGMEMAKELIPISYEGRYANIKGFVGRPTLTRGSQDYIYAFVNGRFVRNRIISRGIASAYEGLIPQDRFPVAFVFVELEPWKVDVNVHPTKIDIRFDDERAIYSDIFEAIRSSLLQPAPIKHIAPRMDLGAKAPETRRTPLELSPREDIASQAQGYRIIGQLHNTYLLVEVEDGLLIIDQHAAHERLIYERLLSSDRWKEKQPLLVPIPFELDSGRAQLLLSISEGLSEIGFEVERFGETSFVIRAIPVVLEGSEALEAINEILEEAMDGSTIRDVERKRICSIIACKAAIRAGMRLDPQEVGEMIRLLDKGPAFNTCPHGRPISFKIPRSDLDRRFRR